MYIRGKIKKICPTCKCEFFVWHCDKDERIYCKRSCVRRTAKQKELASKVKLGRLNPMWKGAMAGLDAIHIWVAKRLPKPKKCQHCKKVPPYDLANISQKYRRSLNDWKWLCRRCHMLSDGRMRNLKQNHL